MAKNVASKQTLEFEVFIQKSLHNVVLVAPRLLQASEIGVFNLSHLSIEPTNVSWDFGDGITFQNSTISEVEHCYLTAGVFNVRVEAFNLVSNIVLSKTVIVQNRIGLFQFKENDYIGEVGLPLYLSIFQNGTNTSILVDYKDGKVVQIVSNTTNQTINLSYTYNLPGIYQIVAIGSNLVSIRNASIKINVEQRITGMLASIVCYGNTVYCFEKDSFEITVNTTTGSHINFVYDFGNGNHTNSSLTKIISAYQNKGNFTAKVTAYNSINSLTVSLQPILVKKLIPIDGLEMSCNSSVQLSNITFCRLSIVNGNGFACTVKMGDGKVINFTYPNFRPVTEHTYNKRGTFTVQFSCWNNYGTKTEVFSTQVGSHIDLVVKHVSRAIANEPITFTLKAKFQGEQGTCFVMDFGDGIKVGYYTGSAGCEVKHPGITFREVPSDFSYLVNHTYVAAGIYNISWTGSNLHTNDSFASFLVVTNGLCLLPQLEFTNLNTDAGRSLFEILRSERYAIRTKIYLDCKEATGSVISWKIKREVSTNKYVEVKNIVTEVAEFILESLSLPIGLYTITCMFQLLGVPHTFNSTKESFKIVPSPLKPIILHGPLVRAPFQSQVTLDGTHSYDPDEPTHGIIGMNFHWHCVIPPSAQINVTGTSPISSLEGTFANYSSSSCYTNVTNDTKPVYSSSNFILPSLFVDINSTLLIKLTVRKDDRSASAIVVLQIAPEYTPFLTIR